MPVMGILLISFLLAGCNAKKVESFDVVVSDIEPSTGATAGGTQIYITGSGLSFVRSVTIAGEECEDLNIASDGQLSCTTPEGTEGDATVFLTNSIGKTKSTTFTYENVPVIDDISPSVGSIDGATPITISGSGFRDGADLRVDFGGAPCTVTLVDDESIECTTTAHASGNVLVRVTNPDGKSTTSRRYAFRPVPTVSTISPTGGPLTGFTTVTIDGTGFSPGAHVTIGGVNCSSVSVTNAGQLTCLTGVYGLEEEVDVIVTNSSGLEGSRADLFTYRNPPTVTSIIPGNGFASVATPVSITGTGFLPLVAGTSVSLGNTACTGVTVNSDTNITCSAPPSGAGVVTVTVTNPDTQTGFKASGYEYVSAPVVLSVSPSYGVNTGGTAVTITGAYFQTTVDPTVLIGGVACAVTAASATSITCTSGDYSGTGVGYGLVNVLVTNVDTQVDDQPNAFTYRAQPTITSVSPNAGSTNGTTAVIITGTNFYSGATVLFDTASCIGVSVTADGTTLTCTTGSHAAGGVTVKVKNDDNQEGTQINGYTYQGAPTVTSVSPSRGVPSGGTPVTLTGTNFFGGARVYFSQTSGPALACTGIMVVNTTTITCTTPSFDSEGPSTITVTNADTQSGSLVGGFNYQDVLLAWSPTTYDFGSATDFDLPASGVFRLTNSGEANTVPITVSKTGSSPTAYTVSDVDCNNAILGPGGFCDVNVTFLASSAAIGAHAANLYASTADGDTATSTLSGSVVNAHLEWDALASGDHGVVVADDTIIIDLDNSGTASSTAPTFTVENGDAAMWTVDSHTCGVAVGAGDTCTVTVTFHTGAAPADTYRTDLKVTAAAGGTTSIVLQAIIP